MIYSARHQSSIAFFVIAAFFEDFLMLLDYIRYGSSYSLIGIPFGTLPEVMYMFAKVLLHGRSAKECVNRYKVRDAVSLNAVIASHAISLDDDAFALPIIFVSFGVSPMVAQVSAAKAKASKLMGDMGL